MGGMYGRYICTRYGVMVVGEMEIGKGDLVIRKKKKKKLGFLICAFLLCLKVLVLLLCFLVWSYMVGDGYLCSPRGIVGLDMGLKSLRWFCEYVCV